MTKANKQHTYMLASSHAPGMVVRIKQGCPPAVLLHCYGTGDRSVGIHEYREDFIIQPVYAAMPNDLLAALVMTVKEFIDIGPGVNVCPGPAACYECNPACDECGFRDGKHSQRCASRVPPAPRKGKARRV